MFTYSLFKPSASHAYIKLTTILAVQFIQFNLTSELNCEKKENGTLPFLDVLVQRTTDGSLCTSIYRKPTFSGLYLRWDSFVPKTFKKGLVNGLLCRAWRLCSNYTLFHSEVLCIRETLKSNGYPVTFLDSCIKKFLDKQFTPDEILQSVFGPPAKLVCICLPYCGVPSLKLKRQISRTLSAVCPWIQLRVVFTPVCKLTTLSKLKSSLHKLMRSNVVYKLNCKDCSEFYIGMTCRRLEQRIGEHSTSVSSAVLQHMTSLGHDVAFNDPQILAHDNNWFRLGIKETLNIHSYKAYKSLNKNTGSYECALW